jgi:hypothetical protein
MPPRPQARSLVHLARRFGHGSALLAFMLGLAALGCEERPAPRGPDVVVQEFLRGLQSAHGHPEAGAKVVELLWKPARDNLTERAARASALSGRELAPGEMIAPSWLSLALPPDHFEWRQDGDWAEVRVTAADGRSMSTRCALEAGDWKVVLELPALPPIRQREEVPESPSPRRTPR